MKEIEPDYEIEISETEVAETSDLQKMKTSWYMEPDSEKKVIEIRPGSDDCISLHGAQEAKHFIGVLEEIIQEIF